VSHLFKNFAFFCLRPFIKTRIIIIFVCFFFGFLDVTLLSAQTFSATISTPVDLAAATGTCVSPGVLNTSYFEIPVTGVSTLTSTNALYSVTLSFNGNAGSYRVRNLNIILQSPSGTCVTVYAGGNISGNNGGIEFYNTLSGANTTRGTGFDMKIVTNTSCLRYPNSYTGASGYLTNATGSGFSTDGNGIVLASPNNLTTGFNGMNPNGNWKLIFTGTGITDSPTLVSASITFANPTTSDQTSNGDNCVSAINWTGTPICAQTNGKSSSANMPGWMGPGPSSFGTFASAQSCDWNGSNNNDVWVKFVAQSTNVCINISSLNPVNQLQSVVVSDPNTDGDNNPCTGSGGGQYWELVNCPRAAIYTTTGGRSFAHNHCFAATIGKTYYLVVDGNGGAESPFYISGVSGTTYNALPIELVNLNVLLKDRITEITWQTASERDNDFFTVERSANGIDWEVLELIDGAGVSNELVHYETYDNYPLKGISYYRLKQTDFDGKATYSDIKSISNTEELMVLPNPGNGIFYVSGLSDRKENQVIVMDVTGKIIANYITEDAMLQMNLEDHPAGIYYVKVNEEFTIKIVKWAND
jgi:hypothetical protein